MNDFQSLLSFHHVTRVTSRAGKADSNQSIVVSKLSVFAIFRLINLGISTEMEEIHANQIEEVLPYQYEPEPGHSGSDKGDLDSSESEISDISDDEVDHAFER